MTRTLKLAAIALVAGATFATAGAASAADTVTFSVGNVAIGYSDGYWDRSHAWHAWDRAEHRDTYRAAKDAEFHDWRHDRDKDMGWHERK